MYTWLAETSYDSEQKIWSGKRRKDLFGPDVTLGEAAHFILGLQPHKVVQVMDSTGEELTAAQLLRQSRVMAKSLLRLGLKPGDVVGISASNTTYLSAVMLGAFLCGMPTNALFPHFDEGYVKILFNVTRPNIIFCDVENYAIIEAAAKELSLHSEIYVLNGERQGAKNVKQLLIDDGKEIDITSLPCNHMTGDDTAAIIFSSGTTGIPKGILCSHKVLLYQTMVANLQSESVLFTFSTMYWASGLWIFAVSLAGGVKRIITDQPFTAEYYLQLVEKYGITHTISGLQHILELIQHATPTTHQRLSSMHSMLCGGSQVPQAVSQKMQEIFDHKPRPGFSVCFGMSELAGILSVNDGGPGKQHLSSAGKLVANTEVKVVDQRSGKLLGINERGMLHIRIPYKWAGYYKNVVASNKSYVDGWLVSGDIGYFDSEGFLYVCAREADVFMSNGHQIYPPQIEDIIVELPGVLEACVFGVPDLAASHLTAVAVVRTDNEQGRAVTEKDILEQVSRKLSAEDQIVAGVHFVKVLPRTGSGKVQRKKVLEMIRAAE